MKLNKIIENEVINISWKLKKENFFRGEFNQDKLLREYKITLKLLETVKKRNLTNTLCLSALIYDEIINEYDKQDIMEIDFSQHISSGVINTVKLLMKYKDYTEEKLETFYAEISENPEATLIKGCECLYDIDVLDVLEKDRFLKLLCKTKYMMLMVSKAKENHPAYKESLSAVDYQLGAQYTVLTLLTKALEETEKEHPYLYSKHS